ncbi:MAG TPA: response regulator transcription factor, partial [Bacteroidota bacterium]|nr:response regulator transcription factor [Bacteroidota bacterium]
IKIALRKSVSAQPIVDAKKAIQIGPIEIFKLQHTVKVSGRTVFLPRKEFDVLLFLAEHPGQVINRSVLLDSVWGSEVQVVDRTVDVHIRKIREKLGKSAEYIETIKGVGYKMREA